MPPLRTFPTRSEAYRARGFLRRSGMRGEIVEHDGGWSLAAAEGDLEAAERVLGALGSLSLEGMGKRPWWERVLNWEAVGLAAATVVALVVIAVSMVAIGSIWWYTGGSLGAVLVLLVAMVIWRSDWASIHWRGGGTEVPWAEPVKQGSPSDEDLDARGHRCGRQVRVEEDRCPFCTAPRPGRR